MTAENPWRDPERQAAARRGIAEARRRLQIVWNPARKVWECDGVDYPTLLAAENAITRGTE